MLFAICEPLCHLCDIVRHCVERLLCTVLSMPFYNTYTYTQYGFFKSFFKVNFDVEGAKFVDDPEKIVGIVKLSLIFTFAVTLT